MLLKFWIIFKDATNKTIQAKKEANGKSNLTMWNLKQFLNQSHDINRDDLKVDVSAQNWLRTNLDIDVSVWKCNLFFCLILKYFSCF